jgi:hypothetical protein
VTKNPEIPDAAMNAAAAAPTSARLNVVVEWADIIKATGDVFVVGHYLGVPPQNAERALDVALSDMAGSPPGSVVDESRLLLTDLTRRGNIRGSLGEVLFFPWKGRGHIVLAGMGRLGTFKDTQLRTLARSLAQTVGRVIPKATISTVLIGSGVGNLKISEAVPGLLAGFAAALAADPKLEIGALRIVERRVDRVYEIVKCALQELPKIEKDHKISVKVEADAVETGGEIPVPFGYSWILAMLAQASHRGVASPFHSSLESLVAALPETVRDAVKSELITLGKDDNPRRLALEFRMGDEQQLDKSQVADRISFAHDGSFIRAAAITNMTTVTARDREMPVAWVDRIVRDLQAPLVEEAEDQAIQAYRYLVHPDLKAHLQSDAPLVLELDRNMARVQWEILRDRSKAEPIAVSRQVARQLRTSYSPRIGERIARDKMKALVIGDPDDTLKWARDEANKVKDILGRVMEVELRIGSSDGLEGLGRYRGIRPADLYDVVALLQSGEYDIVHYCGHAEFSAEFPERSGWQFKDGVLTAAKLEGLERPPTLIIANACVSAALSQPGGPAEASEKNRGTGNETATTRVENSPKPPGDSRLVASLADEFFRRGVEDYIGTAWEVADEAASLFAETFHRALIGDDRETPASIGEAVQIARASLYKHEHEWESGTVWAAYQHYGDPTRRLFDKKPTLDRK